MQNDWYRSLYLKYLIWKLSTQIYENVLQEKWRKILYTCLGLLLYQFEMKNFNSIVGWRWYFGQGRILIYPVSQTNRDGRIFWKINTESKNWTKVFIIFFKSIEWHETWTPCSPPDPGLGYNHKNTIYPGTPRKLWKCSTCLRNIYFMTSNAISQQHPLRVMEEGTWNS